MSPETKCKIARRTTAPRKAAIIVPKKPSVVLGSKRFITSPARNAPTRPTTIMPIIPKWGMGIFTNLVARKPAIKPMINHTNQWDVEKAAPKTRVVSTM